MKMLNEMMQEAETKLDASVAECQAFEEEQMSLMRQTRNDISTFNGGANGAQGSMLQAHASIIKAGAEMETLSEELARHKHQCDVDIANTRDSLAMVTADLGVMEVILNMTQCSQDQDQDAAGKASMLQAQAHAEISTRDATSGQVLVNCPHCLDGKGMVMLQSDTLQPLLNKLKSMYAHKFLQNQLRTVFHESVIRRHAVALTEAGVAHQLKLARGMSHLELAQVSHLRHLHQGKPNETTELADPGISVKVAQEPEEPQPMDCIPTNKCTLSETNCPKMQEKFGSIQGGLMDQKAELEAELAKLEKSCRGLQESMETQLADLELAMGNAQTKYADAAAEKSTAERASKSKAEQYDGLHTEYSDRMTACCNEQNELKSEKCALEKIRGELLKLEGVKLNVLDCEVSAWEPQECTVTCGGGRRKSHRSILVQPANGGVECPAIVKEESCNLYNCPVDCVLDDWGGWGACSADCDGGVQQRTRTVKVEPANQGLPCGETTETQPCNMQSCDGNCQLTDWTEWTGCSKACDKGSQRHKRGIAVPARGTGTCPKPESHDRLQFIGCNDFPCDELLGGTGRKIVKCSSKVDIVVILDGSASLGTRGWQQTKDFAERFISNLEGGNGNVHIALQVFSRGVKWIRRFSNDTAEVASAVQDAPWPRSLTSTAKALIQAEAELIHGRPDADTVVIVVTDGRPTGGNHQTELAAESLKQKARILWVAVGLFPPMKLIRKLASEPQAEHVMRIKWYSQLDDAKTVNAVIANTCPILA